VIENPSVPILELELTENITIPAICPVMKRA
jgi:hypothetical protein